MNPLIEEYGEPALSNGTMKKYCGARLYATHAMCQHRTLAYRVLIQKHLSPMPRRR
jgi:hypothetical protein